MSRIGLFGGTFDPPHVGHIAVAATVRHELALDEVRLVVAGDPYQKRGTRPITPAADRLALTTAAVEGVPGLRVDDCEIRRGGPSYTIDTVEDLQRSDPGAEVFVVLGSDALALLHTWARIDDLARLVTFVVVRRPGAPSAVAPPGVTTLDVDAPLIDISSSSIRERAAAGKPIDGLVPAPAASLVGALRLYRSPR